MLIPSDMQMLSLIASSLSRRVNANSQLQVHVIRFINKLIKKGEC